MSADPNSQADFESGAKPAGTPPELHRLSEREVASIIEHEISAAETFTGSSISGKQSENLDAYLGNPMGNEVPDRSQVIMQDVRETVEWMMPQLLNLFLGGKSVVRYAPRTEADEDWAEQMTDYAQFCLRRDGFMTFHDWFKDALIEKLGDVTLCWEEKVNKDLHRYAELSDDEYDELVADDDVEIVGHETSTREVPPEIDEETGDIALDPETGEPMQATEITEHEVHIRRVKKQTRIRMEGVPQEEFLVASRVRWIDDDCPFIGRRKKVTFSDLRGMGFDPALIESLPSGESHEYQQQALERREDEQTTPSTAYDRPDWASREIWLTECFIRIDEDGDGYAELRRILVAGESGLKVLEDDECAHVYHAALCSVPVPHKLYGLAVADLILDLQRIRTTLVRQMLDNTYLTNNPRHEVVEDEVDLESLLDSAPGAPVYVSQPGMVSVLETQPLSAAAFNLLEYMHGVKAERTGVSRPFQGVSTGDTATGTTALLEQANLRIQMIARIFAEMGVKRLYELFLYLCRENKVKDEVIRLRGEWITIEQQAWEADLDVEIEVGLGTEQSALRIDNLSLLLDLQKQIMDFDGRMVTPQNVYAALCRITEAMGFTTDGLFFTPPGEEPPPEPPPDPKMVEIEANQALEMKKLELEAQTLEFRRQQAVLEEQGKEREREVRIRVAEIQRDGMLEQARIQAGAKQYGDDRKQESELLKATTTTAPQQ